jgi:lipopolysaccharide export system permease protein
LKIIYRYILQELLIPFFFGVAAFTGIFIGTDLLFRLAEYYSKWGVGLLILIQLFFLSLPSIIVLTFPMAILLSIIMAFSRLSGNSEITAMRSGGISIYTVVIPVLIIGLIVSGATIFINELVVPKSNYLSEQIIWQFQHGEKKPRTQYNLFLTPIDPEVGRPDYIMYTHRFDADTGTMDDVLLQNYDLGRPDSLIEARKAVWQNDSWHFFDGVIYYLKVGERIPALSFNEYKVRQISFSPEEVSKFNKKINDMSMKELNEYIKLMENQGRDTARERVKWHQRLSIPFASFIFALVAAPLGIQPQRSGGSAMGMGLSIIIIFIYYIVMTIGSALGEQGGLSPFFGAWLQNFIFLIIGGFMLYKAGR